MSGLSSSMAPISTTQPSTTGKGRVDLVKSDFDAAIVQKGYDVYLDKSLRCPCRRIGDTQPLSSCRNCGGSGYLYINRYKTRMIVQAMNTSTKFKEWSEENIGTVRITARDEEDLSFMDRITMIGAEVISSSIIFPKLYDNQVRAKTIYDIKSIDEIFAFQSSSKKLHKLQQFADYTYDGNSITFNEKYSSWNNFTVSIRYKHEPSYHIIDMVRESMTTKISTGTGEKNISLPISSIGRKSHYIIDEQNYNGDYLIDNSYTINGCRTNSEISIPPPTNFYVENDGPSTVNLNWDLYDLEDGSLIIQRLDKSKSWTNISIISSDNHTYEDNTVMDEGIFYYRIAYRVGERQSPWSEIVGIKTITFTCSPVITTINDSVYSTVGSGGSQNIQILNIEGNPVGSLSGSSILIPISEKIYYNRAFYKDTNYVRDLDEAWWISNGANSYNESIPPNSKIQNVDYSNLSILDRLIYNNIHGHKFRFTGTSGGYYNPDDGNYYDVNGNISTKTIEFPPIFSGRHFIIDHLTGYMWIGRRLGTIEWDIALDYAEDLDIAGYSDWRVPSNDTASQLYDNRYDRNLYNTSRPPWDYDQPYFWTCTNSSANRTGLAISHSSFNHSISQNKAGRSVNRSVFRIHLTGTIN